MIHVVATIDVAPGKRAAFLEHFHWVTPFVLAEDGCIEYGPAVDLPIGLAVQNAERPNTVVVIEKWADAAALQIHLQAPHMAEYRERVRNLVTGVVLQVLTPA